jgi:DNA-binding NtrC family response regulator
MTGGATDPRLRQAVRAGLYRLLPKPFETDRLLGVLAALRQGADPSTSDLALVMDPISRAS